jgi:uroporphyrin-III C-methyltransferase/precorrin-2 dehydrogenase/sirohydrochlorin ferrochelatase
VALVGGGPGDPGLVTTRGRRLLAQADVVVVDRLAPRDLLDDLADDVEVIDVGKTSGHHPVPQERISALLVEHALAGSDVVRLKGGDPYVFGRGGEELEACRAHGIAVEVVPGVTSAVSVPAAVGIPVTHRGVARGFTVLTGHDDVGQVPAGPDHTLVLLMGVTRLAATAAALVSAGRAPSTPAAVVEDGYGPRQRVTVGTLADIAERAAAAGARAPAVTVVGDVVTLSPAWAAHSGRDAAVSRS